jgi:hypothetical protein
MDFTKSIEHHVARNAANKVRPGGTLIFMGGTGGRRPAIGMSATYDIDGGQQFVAAS